MTMALLGASAALVAMASPISPQQALERVQTQGMQKISNIDAGSMSLVYTAKMADNVASAYIFASPAEEGFMVLSADDTAMPLLGYSDTERFDASNMPPALKWWLGEYGRRLEYLNEKGVKRSNMRHAPADWQAVAPLVKTRWDQGSPYDQQTPKLNDVNCPTGCVATSLAQVMNYFKYPEIGEGRNSYRWNGKNLGMNFGLHPFDWDNMLDVYTSGNYTQENADAVAFLMKSCGYGVEMNYGSYASGAQSYKIVSALTTYFGYDKGARYEDRNFYSSDEWMEMIYNNIKNVGPVIYNGTSPMDGGHSFVCDGYDGKGYFHINWGWGGMSDGYYSLDVLNPEAQGAGSSLGGYNYSQDAVLGIKKPGSEPAPEIWYGLRQYGSTVASLDGMVLSMDAADYGIIGWGPMNYDQQVNAKIGVEIKPATGGEAQYITGKLGNFETLIMSGPTYYSNSYDVPTFTLPSGLSEGVYKVTLSCKNNLDADSGWQPVHVFYGYSNYCWLRVENGQYSVENVPIASIDFESVTLGSPLYNGYYVKLDATMKNSTDYQVTVCVTPQLRKDGKVQFQGDSFLVSVDSQSEVEKSWAMMFYQAQDADTYRSGQEYDLILLNQDSGTILKDCGKVVMESFYGTTSVKLDRFEIENASKSDVTVGNKTFRDTYDIKDKYNIPVELEYHVTRGYFDKEVSMRIYRYNENQKTEDLYLDDVFSEYPFLTVDEYSSAHIDVNLGDAPNGIYIFKLFYYRMNSQSVLGQLNVQIGNDSGVNGIVLDKDAETVVYFDMLGNRVVDPVPGQLLIRNSESGTMKIIY